MMDMPYFMENEEWFYFDYEQKKHVLTDKAPKEAIESYVEYYKQLAYFGKNSEEINLGELGI